MIKVLTAEFVTTATQLDDYPRENIPEVAFVGRSNVGKSSMINTLANRRKLVRVSNTPGRTKTLNFFDVALEHRAKKRTVRLCDLPGYGFAKVPKSERAIWDRMINTYLSNRHTLKVVVCIIDGEIGPTPDDLEMLDFLQDKPPRILVVATKLDRISKSARKPQLLKIQQKLELPDNSLLGFSSHDDIGHQDVWRTLLGIIG
ncbi:MAG: ribosome biogenesis GTP-binding protein YihA/YsxC [Archangium sp.]|nr:ribosome biogenesis GTP-binding protein YihA/YsxC [Archangium sp.]MDP3155311.1 ribosome biogenesis GTP-binding protein YihA/YsxC [Archangium sp.]MDP3574765.1 ribosome biogenesis GTP-binding protein YihA/YsxC [Archangium sp.]